MIIKYNNYIKENIENKEVIFLVGLPGVGKSTWIDKNINKDLYTIISCDDIRHEFAKEYDIKYDDLFKDDDFIKDINEKISKKLMYLFYNALENDKNIIIDMQNINKKSRKGYIKIINRYNKNYKIKAIVFNFFDIDTLKKVSDKRSEKTDDKYISLDLYKKQLDSYIEPSKEEGFDEIVYVNDFEYLNNYLKESIDIELSLSEEDEFLSDIDNLLSQHKQYEVVSKLVEFINNLSIDKINKNIELLKLAFAKVSNSYISSLFTVLANKNISHNVLLKIFSNYDLSKLFIQNINNINIEFFKNNENILDTTPVNKYSIILYAMRNNDYDLFVKYLNLNFNSVYSLEFLSQVKDIKYIDALFDIIKNNINYQLYKSIFLRIFKTKNIELITYVYNKIDTSVHNDININKQNLLNIIDDSITFSNVELTRSIIDLFFKSSVKLTFNQFLNVHFKEIKKELLNTKSIDNNIIDDLFKLSNNKIFNIKIAYNNLDLNTYFKLNDYVKKYNMYDENHSEILKLFIKNTGIMYDISYQKYIVDEIKNIKNDTNKVIFDMCEFIILKRKVHSINYTYTQFLSKLLNILADLYLEQNVKMYSVIKKYLNRENKEKYKYLDDANKFDLL